MVRAVKYEGSITLLEIVRVYHVRANENLANPLTKGLAREKAHNISKKMRLIPIEK